MASVRSGNGTTRTRTDVGVSDVGDETIESVEPIVNGTNGDAEMSDRTRNGSGRSNRVEVTRSTRMDQSDRMAASAAQEREGLGVDDLALPRTLVQRLAKGALPAQTQLQKDALLAISKSTTVFVNMLAAEAAALAAYNGKKTIQPADVLVAVDRLEFPAFASWMQAELEAYQKVKSGKRSVYREKVREREAAAAAVVEDESVESETRMVDVGEAPVLKKRRQGIDGGVVADEDDEMVDGDGDGDVEDDDDNDENDDDEDDADDGDGPEEDDEAAMMRVDDLDGDRGRTTGSLTRDGDGDDDDDD